MSPRKTASKKASESFSIADSLIEAFAINNRVNEYLVRAVPDPAWSAKPPDGKGRNIAAIFAHIHNVRGMWLKACLGEADIPEKLDRLTCTKDDVVRALEQSRQALAGVLRRSLDLDGRIHGFKPDAGAFLGYLVAHDAHHRGQITMLARQLGHPISQSAMFGMWEWGKR